MHSIRNLRTTVLETTSSDFERFFSFLLASTIARDQLEIKFCFDFGWSRVSISSLPTGEELGAVRERGMGFYPREVA